MPIDPAATPLDNAHLAREQDRERRAWLVRAQSDAARHQAAADQLTGAAAAEWTTATPVLAALGLVAVPLCLGLYTWAFAWLPLEPVPAPVPAVLLCSLLVAVGLASGPAGGERPTAPPNWARGAVIAVLMVGSGLLLACAPDLAAGERVWLGAVGLAAAACLIALPRHLVVSGARRRAARYQRLADRAREDAAYLGLPDD